MHSQGWRRTGEHVLTESGARILGQLLSYAYSLGCLDALGLSLPLSSNAFEAFWRLKA